MNIKHFFILLLLHSFVIAYSQHTVRDSLTHEKISFVEIYSDNGNLIGLTNSQGEISTQLNSEISASKTNFLTFIHPTFNNKIIPVKLFKNNPIVYLSPIIIELKEVVIVPKPKKYKYLKLKGYFRSIQINDDKPQYFIDGIVEYYISVKSGNVKNRIVSNRSFENKSIKQISSSFHFSVAGAPMFNKFFTYKNLIGQYDFDSSNGESIKLIDKKERKEKGVFKTLNEDSVMQLEIISKENPKIMSLFGVESNFNNYTVNTVYSTNNIEKMDLDNLTYFKEIRNYNVKRKKEEKYTRIDATHEFFLIEKEYVNEIGSKGSESFYFFLKPSNYLEDYWKSIDNELFQPLPKSLEAYIEQNLIEIKK